MKIYLAWCYFLLCHFNGYYQFNTNLDLNIPDEFEAPEEFKDAVRLQLGVSYIARLVSKMTGGALAEWSLQREIMNLFMPTEKGYSYVNMTVIDKEMDGVTVRSYRPINTENLFLPCLIFYHGGGYASSSIETYDYYIYNIAKEANIAAISVEYRLVPENPFPVPWNDCLTVAQYVIKNAEMLGIDRKRLIISGDSAGGHAAAVVTLKLTSIYKDQNIPKAQLLIYPLLQNYNFRLPSRIYYDFYDTKDQDTLNSIETIYWMMGITDISRAMQDTLKYNYHTLLIKDKATRLKLSKRLSLNLIPEEYKRGYVYYNKTSSMYPTKLDSFHILNTDLNLANRLFELFTLEYSPSLVDDEDLKRLPLTYFIICEFDMLKDENLIYAERLKQNGVPVKVNFYRDANHGMINAFPVSPAAARMFDDLVRFLRNEV